MNAISATLHLSWSVNSICTHTADRPEAQCISLMVAVRSNVRRDRIPAAIHVTKSVGRVEETITNNRQSFMFDGFGGEEYDPTAIETLRKQLKYHSTTQQLSSRNMCG